MKYLFLLFFLFLLLNKIIGLNNNSENTNKQNIFDWIFNRHGHNFKNKTKEFVDTKTKCVYCQNPTIELTGGKIEGRISFVAGKNKPAIVFEGIPFSEPPIGKLRFLPLKEKKPWNGILNATNYSAACLSNTTSTRSPQKYISEDCIYINIFTSPKCLASFYISFCDY